MSRRRTTPAMEECLRVFELERAYRLQRFPPGSKCLLCGFDDLLVLQKIRCEGACLRVYCADCDAVVRGKPVRVGHHAFHRQIPLVIEVSRNEHELYNILERWRGPAFEPISGQPYGIMETFVVQEYIARNWGRNGRFRR